MPNLKIYVDETIFEASRASFHEALPRIRDLLCEAFQVAPSACQLAVIPVVGLPDQPQLNIELLILPHTKRTETVIRAAAEKLRDLLNTATGAHGAVRIAHLDPVTYVALK
ncbi:MULTISPECIES: hypothetical protein [Rhizobium/Agrobacterium group]|uniref:Uncharacterized protein n=2 Tax=Rhizobium/Agrobacterium group TaxID=227290 RepID=B9K5E2_ALLAM|nr:hypothetical protein [Allorhizobium ampelinum]MUO28434.1 hypothetical protein [Agrobacterium vitis]ACM40090.1 hypothetical protein Avi_7442 [Allorhizobium ampelinum S4]MCF1450228.1 hypothetical protein [Allorhizobium ampelinum]MCF1493751.1 hypothetical protein [Allorhizobium ampelinum]MUO41316.1 hypothetical protein [Agrobacterium vitis]